MARAVSCCDGSRADGLHCASHIPFNPAPPVAQLPSDYCFDKPGLIYNHESMPVDVLTEIVIERPLDIVARFAADPDNVPQWYANIRSVEWQSPCPLAVGSRLAFVAQFLGRRMAYTYEIIVLMPAERLVMRTAERPFPMETQYTWQSITPGTTRMTLRNPGEPAGFPMLLAPFMALAIRQANRKDLARLKHLLEHP